MTEATYRKKALKYLLEDFQRRCAYCIDPDEFRHPSQNQVDHFDCHIRGRERNYYKNLMLACSTCNLCKHDKPVLNPLDKEQHLLNCTEENEFPEHIVEEPNGQWRAETPSGKYHLVSIELNEPCHVKKRFWRRRIAEQMLENSTKAIQYQCHNPVEIHQQIMAINKQLLALLETFPPLVTEHGVKTTKQWLEDQGVIF